MKIIDNFLNGITMYKVVLYGLLLLTSLTLALSLIGIGGYTFVSLIASLSLLLFSCWLTNTLFAKLFKVPTNVESVWITAFILFLIVAPISTINDAIAILLTGILAMASKYLLNIAGKHIFNPAAIALVIMGLAGSGIALWWSSSQIMLPFILIIGLLIVRKVRRFALFSSFVITSLLLLTLSVIVKNGDIGNFLYQVVTSWPLFFLGTIMLTEPLTTPPTKDVQVVYGIVVGAFFSSQFHFGPIFSTPEFALIIGNIFSYLVSEKERLILTLQNSTQQAAQIFDFAFSSNRKFSFNAGQYMEWTLAHEHPDNRGNRRYFTIASAPTENTVHLGVKIQPNSSSFKKKLASLKTGDHIVASQVAGEFTLPKSAKTKLVFIAGGIGITPFRSMVQYLMDTADRRDIVLLYACNNENDFAYQEIFQKAEKALGLKRVCIISEKERASPTWSGKIGRINQQMLAEMVPDFKTRTFYISGPGAMVDAYKELLRSLGVASRQIKTDYFPGF